MTERYKTNHKKITSETENPELAEASETVERHQNPSPHADEGSAPARGSSDKMKKDMKNGNNSATELLNGSTTAKTRPLSEKDAKNSSNVSGRIKQTAHASQANGYQESGGDNSNGSHAAQSESVDAKSAGHPDRSIKGENSVNTRAKTAKPNGQRSRPGTLKAGPGGEAAGAGGGGGGGGVTQADAAKKPAQQTPSKPPGNRLEPLEQQPANQKHSTGTATPRSRGSDDSDSDRKVSFRETPQDQGEGVANTTESRERQDSLSKKRSGSNRERPWPATARETFTSDLARDSPRHEGATTWRKVNSDTMLVPRFTRDSRDPDALSDSGFSLGRCDQAWESSGRKFTRKSARGNLGSSTTLSSNTDNSDDAEDNFNVVLRVRPPNAQERNRRDQFVVDFPGDGQVSVNNQGTVRSFQFNVVLEPDAAQEDVFETSGMKKLIEAAIMGYTCTAFAFGQTGSGKTHTMTGPPAQISDMEEEREFHTEGVTPDPNMYGIIQRSFKHLFQQLKRQATPKYVRASYMEIYNEQVIDLLNPNQRRYLSVRWSKNKGFYVENLFTVECETIDDLMAVLEEGLRNRQTGSHGLNEFSSRSHSVLTVTIDSETQPEPEDENLYVTKRGKISFVDLAGSEKVKDSTAPGGPGMVESNSINKSLLVLGNCISHLGDSKRRLGHIPYRDSKLTKLLADSLGGNGITLMIACITPSSSNVTETLNTLRYASRAKKIKSKPTVKMDPREKLIVTLKKEIKILRQENHYLRQQLDFPAKPKGQLQKENDEKFMKFMKEQQQKETGLYEMLQEYMVENETLRAENSEMHQVKESSRREQQILYKENEKLSRRVEELERLMSEHPGTWSLVDHRRTDGYGQHDLSPRGSPVTVGYMSPTHRGTVRPTDLPVGGSRVKVSSPTSHGQPKKPPHRLADHVTRPVPRPVDYVEDIPNGYISPRQASLVKQGAMSPRPLDRKASQVSQTDMIRGMNEQLRREVMQLDGEIQHHTRGATQTLAKSYYR